MRFFFRSKQFKVIVTVVIAVILLTVSFAVFGKRMSPATDIAGSLAAPFRSLTATVSSTIEDFFTAYTDGNQLSLENAELKSEISKLQEKLADYEKISTQNEFYKDYLGIKDQNPDFTFVDANLIARDNDDPYGSFTVNRGSASGITKYDPVITNGGIVGYITEVGLTSSKVTTILNPDITLGALDDRTNDSGLINGTLSLAEKGFTRFCNLSRSCSVAVGDYVITSGEGIFPEGLLVGMVENIGIDENNTSIYAEVKPFVASSEIRTVMVITEFEGQGGITVGGDKK